MRFLFLIIALSVPLFSQGTVVDASIIKDIQAGFYFSAFFTNQGDENSSRDDIFYSLFQNGFSLYAFNGRYYIKSCFSRFPVIIMEMENNHLKLVDFVEKLPSNVVLIENFNIKVGISYEVENFKFSAPEKFNAIRKIVIETIADKYGTNNDVLYISPINNAFPEFYVLLDSQDEELIIRFSLASDANYCQFITHLRYSKEVANFIKSKHIEKIIFPLAGVNSKND